MHVDNGVVGRAEMVFDATSFYIRIPLSMLDGDDGYMNTAALVGNSSGPTDCIPNSGSLGVKKVFLPAAMKP